MGCVPNSLSAAKCLNMATPIIVGQGSGKTVDLLNGMSYQLSEVLKMFRMVIFWGL